MLVGGIARLGVPESRWVSMPSSTSLVIGSGARRLCRGRATQAQAAAAGGAAVVIFSRVYTGVHYPGDVVVGAAVGALLGRATSTVARRLGRR